MLNTIPKFTPKTKYCHDCKYFLHTNHKSVNFSETNFCTKFYTFDETTHRKQYENMSDVRKQEHKCGPKGIYFERLSTENDLVTMKYDCDTIDLLQTIKENRQ